MILLLALSLYLCIGAAIGTFVARGFLRELGFDYNPADYCMAGLVMTTVALVWLPVMLLVAPTLLLGWALSRGLW